MKVAPFTDYYGQQSCTAGRAAFILGQTPFRTGLLKVGMPAAKQGLQDSDPTIAELLKPLGYASAQIGKNHLGDRNEYLPTVHGFDEFYGILYHLNAMEEPYDAEYPKDPEFHARFGPRNIVDTRATDVDDPTEHLPRRCHCKLPSSRLSRSNLARKSPEKRGKHRLWRGLLGVDRRTVIEDIEFDELGADGAQLVVARVRPRTGVSRRCGRCQRRAPWYDRGQGARRWRGLDLGTVQVVLEADARG